MTLDETRQLGIEFERRIQTMIPETQYASKLDTETIYSYLNQYLDKYIHDIYRSIDAINSPSKPSAYVETLLQGLLKKYTQNVRSTNGEYKVKLPSDFGLYVDSSTTVSKSYEYKVRQNVLHSGILHNVLMSATVVENSLHKPHDTMRIIREPMAYITNNESISVIHDRYTIPVSFNMTYYKIPLYMNLFESKVCELPIDSFEDVVSGAVDLYVQYAAGAEARRKQIAEQARRNRKEDDNERG